MKKLNDNQRAVLQAVRELGPVTVGAVAAHLGISLSSAHTRMNTLVRHRCVEQTGVGVSGGAAFEVTP